MVFTLATLKVIWQNRFYSLLSSNKHSKKVQLYFLLLHTGTHIQTSDKPAHITFSMLLVAADGSTQGIDITPSKVRRSEAARGLRAHNSFFLFSCQVGGVYLEWNLGVGERTLSFCFSFANDAQFSKQRERSKDVILTRPSE